MHKIEALTAVSFTSGRFKLTEEQYRRRRYAVTVVDKDELVVEPKPQGQISFKRGEIVETDVKIAKGTTILRLVDEPMPALESPNELEPSASTDPAAGGSDAIDPVGAEVGNSDDPLASIDIGVSSPSVDTATEQKPGKRSRGK